MIFEKQNTTLGNIFLSKTPANQNLCKTKKKLTDGEPFFFATLGNDFLGVSTSLNRKVH